MPTELPRLFPASDPNDRVKIQETAFSHDVLGRYVCNNWDEIFTNQNGGYPFDAVVIGAGMFGGYAAEKLYRHGEAHALRILLIDAGTFVLGTHIQNLPQRLGGDIGGAPLRTRDDGTKNAIWGMPWISNEGFPGLAYCVGGRSLFWGGWSPRLTADDLALWPDDLREYLAGAHGVYPIVEEEIGVKPSTDYIRDSELFEKLKAALTTAATTKVKTVALIDEAPLAVQGSSPASGVFSFDKFSSGPFLIDAIRHDAANNFTHGDVSRRIFLLPRTQVLHVVRSGNAVTALELSNDGVRRTLTVDPSCVVLLANGAIESTRLALDGLGVGSTRFGSPRAGNLMAHLRSNVTVRIKASALGLTPPYAEAQTTALIARGTAHNRRFHIQITAAAIGGADPEKNLWSMVPDIDQLAGIVANQSTDWISITFRCIGEMEDGRTLDPDPARNWVDLSGETDSWGARRAYAQLATTPADEKVWTAMDKAAFGLAETIAGGAANIEYWDKANNRWTATRPQPAQSGRSSWQDSLGTTHHEAGTLFMGAPGAAITDTFARFHGVDNAYVIGPAAFPTLGSANPSLTALSLALRTANAVIARHAPAVESGFAPLSLSPADWRVVRRPADGTAGLRHYGNVLETFDGYALAFYAKEEFADFILRLEWRVARRDDNSGVYIRTPGAGGADPLGAADRDGHEIQIDERGFDSNTNTEGHPQKITGALYDLQAPTAFASRPIGSWNAYEIEARGAQIKVTLNGQLINTITSTRRLNGFLALQAHHFTSRVQFRNLRIRKV